MPKLSIITINYNNASGLNRTLTSVLNQTFSDYEYIVIDGGSTDGSVDVIKQFENKISYWVSEKDSGIYNAMNKGIKKATGMYCLFLNSGDYLVNNNVLDKIFSSAFSEDIIYGNMNIDYLNGKIEKGKMPDKIDVYQMYIDTLWHPVSFIKRRLFELYGNYDESYKIVADYEFFFRVIVQKKVSLKHIPIPVSVFVFDGASSSEKNKQTEKMERERVWKTYLTEKEIEQLAKKRVEENEKKKKLINRIINKLKL